MKRPPSRIEPYENLPEVLDFPRDIQPILDRHCVACHHHDRRDGDVNLSGDRTPYYSTAYWTMFSKSLVVDGRNQHGNRPPRTIGSSASPLMACLDRTHDDVRVSGRERFMIRTWIDSGATYSGTYACLESGMFPVRGTEDHDYHTILARIEDAARQLHLQKRFDMPGSRPNRYYIRQMQLFGILPEDLPAAAPIDPYATDQAYWRTFRFVPCRTELSVNSNSALASASSGETTETTNSSSQRWASSSRIQYSSGGSGGTPCSPGGVMK